MSDAPVRLIADLGGTNARFATVCPHSRDLERIEVLACVDYPAIEGAIAEYRERHGLDELDEVCPAAAR